MCGILTITGKGISEEVASKALDTLRHRGPDDRGLLAFANTVLGHTRLAFIDLSPLGHQPMKDNARNMAITFNGEIYNYRELREKLEKKGHHFTSHSDTEVILKSYIEYGEECPVHLDGMFAFAIWDEDKQYLFMARDRFGKKPLYLAYDPQGRLVVASEIKALLAAGVKGELDHAGVDLYLALTYVPPWRSVYKNIQVLEPAHSATYTNGTLTKRRYWALESKPLAISYPDAKEEVRRLLKDAVRKRLIADVEIGSFLSGGVDSTLITAYAQESSTTRLKTFALGYGAEINELPYAAEAARTIGTEHHTLEATGNLPDELERVLAYFDEPHADSADIAQHLLSQETARYVKAALAGDGGDELFLGYGWYWRYWNTSKLTRLKNLLLSNPFQEHLRLITILPLPLRRALLKDPQLVGSERIDALVGAADAEGIQKINLFDLTTYLPGQLLSKVDRASMMHSLEVRCPFLDHQLAEFAFNLPEAYKTDRAGGKIILKDLLSEIMPPVFVNRKKQGFGAPVGAWLQRDGMRAYVEKTLAPGARIYELLNQAPATELVEKAYARKHAGLLHQVWVLLCLAVWLEKHS